MTETKMPSPINIIFDPILCISCGTCAKVCVTGKITSNEHFDPILHQNVTCISCGQCIAFCPAGAVTTDSPNLLNTDKPKAYTSGISSEILSQYLKSRRSNRVWKDEPLSKEICEDLISVASYAPSGINIHPTKWVIVTDTKKVREFSKASMEFLKTLPSDHPAAGFVQMILGNPESDPICRDAPAIIIAVADENSPSALVDSVIALSYIDVYAQSLGVGTCWVGYVMGMLTFNPELGKILGVPSGVVPQYAMLAGYAKHKPKQIPPRRMAEIFWG